MTRRARFKLWQRVWDDGLNAGAAHQSRLGVTILEAKSPDQATEREHLSRVDFARHETAELKGALRTGRDLSAELSADSAEGSSVREDIDSILRDEIEVSDVALADDPEEDLRLRFVAAMAMCEDESITVVDNSATDLAEFECSANEIDLEDYAHELAFLPNLTDSASTVLDYGGSNVVCSAHMPSQREKLVKALKAQEGIMIASGNALPPPTYGAICDIDVQGHKPIKQRARRVPLKHLKKLYELLNVLLKAGLIAFSYSPWASPIVIVLKKNGVDIRLCIDYKMVNAITVLMEYAMPLVDELLTELESYLWFCTLDAASGFWAKVRRAEAASATQRGRLTDPNQPTPDSVNSATKFEADHRALAESDPLRDLVNSPESDMFANGEPDVSTLTPVFDRRSFVDDICFGGTTFEDCLATLSRLLARFAECRISISFTKSIFVQPAVDFLSHEVSQHGIRANPAKLAAIAELPFPTSKKGMQGFLGALDYYNRFILNMAVYVAVLYQLKDADFADGGDLAAAKSAFAVWKTKVANAQILRHFDSAKEVHIMLFANAWALISFAVLLSPYHLKVKRIRELDADDRIKRKLAEADGAASVIGLQDEVLRLKRDQQFRSGYWIEKVAEVQRERNAAVAQMRSDFVLLMEERERDVSSLRNQVQTLKGELEAARASRKAPASRSQGPRLQTAHVMNFLQEHTTVITIMANDNLAFQAPPFVRMDPPQDEDDEETKESDTPAPDSFLDLSRGASTTKFRSKSSQLGKRSSGSQ
ncbi:unnamed protein product [Phytophthora fragariaefolia]|uniref:Unnamed protein product n=1 Tax=Phytophthora fragariaefolia TaxID=1490495 RepID=A0A9W6YAN3_9STRA|nr:unnamed protein product [Phytophthora fragariaefolia]